MDLLAGAVALTILLAALVDKVNDTRKKNSKLQFDLWLSKFRRQ